MYYMKTYEALFDEDVVDGVYAISLVNKPAMKGDFIALSEHEEIRFKSVNEEERLLVGLALEPNKKVVRSSSDGTFYNIVFSEETIKKVAHNFFKSNSHKNSNIEHDGDAIDGVTFVESWIVEDPEKDKSLKYGLSYPKGSWMVAMKVDNDAVWNDFVKTGKVKGFSIEAVTKIKEVKLKTEIEMDDKIETGFTKLKEDLKVWFSDVLNKEEKVDAQTEVEVEVKTEAEAEVEAKTENEAEEKLEMSSIIKGVEDTMKVALSEHAKALDIKLSKLEESNKELREEVSKLSKEPAVMATKSSPKSYSEMTNFEKLEFNRENKR